MKPIVKSTNWDTEPNLFKSLPYIYLHGQAQDMNGYDGAEGNIETFRAILSNCVRTATLLQEDGTEHDVLLIPSFFERRVQGLICLCSSLDDIKFTITEYFNKVNVNMYDDEEKWLKDKYPEVYKLFSDYTRGVYTKK